MPALVVSDACLHFMMIRTEHRAFGRFYHQMAERAVKAARRKREEVYQEYRSFEQYYLETFLCRLHDMLVLYFEEVAVEAFEARPDILADSQLKYERGQGAATRREVGLKFLRRKAALPLLDHMHFLAERTGGILGPTEEQDSIAVLAAIRNVIVHGDTLPDNRFFERIGETGFKFEELPGGRIKIDERWLLSVAMLCEKTIFRFDDTLVRALNLHGHFRYGTFWIR